MNQVTSNKFRFVSGNNDEILLKLLQTINIDQIPKKYGGMSEYNFDVFEYLAKDLLTAPHQ